MSYLSFLTSRDPGYIEDALNQALFLEKFISHKNMKKKDLKRIRKKIKKELKYLDAKKYSKCKSLTKSMHEDYSDD